MIENVGLGKLTMQLLVITCLLTRLSGVHPGQPTSSFVQLDFRPMLEIE